MTATDELRRMLDERGVEWEDMSIFPLTCTSWLDHDGEPCTALEGTDDIPDGKLSVQSILTPAQAIAATLGPVITGDTSDGYHTFNELYHHRAVQVTDKLIARLNEENEKLRKIAGGIGYLLFSLDVDYCVACPRDTINHPCPVHTLKGGECLYKTDLRELGVKL